MILRKFQLTDAELSQALIAVYGFSGAKILEIQKGGNSLVVRLRTLENEDLAIKAFLGTRDRQIRALEHELKAFEVLKQNSIINIANFNSYNSNLPSICYEWINGETPSNYEASKKVIASSILELMRLHTESSKSIIPCAIDAIPSSSELLNQLEDRKFLLDRVSLIPLDLVHEFQKTHQRIFDRLSAERFFPIDTLTFSDFGIHNLLVNAAGQYYFLDFEFFGSDSKVKLFSDLFSHPMNIFSSSELQSLLELSDSKNVYEEINFLLPGIALKWAYIAVRRTLNSSGDTFIGFHDQFENPKHFLDYANFLMRNSQNDAMPTFQEFKTVKY